MKDLPVMDAPTRRWRAALFLFMFAAGVSLASWVARTPAVRDALDASTGAMGLVLFGLSVGSMGGVLVSGGLVRKYGGRPVIAVGRAVRRRTAGDRRGHRPGGVRRGLRRTGPVRGRDGLAEVAFNIEGAAVERTAGRPVLPVLHGCFSLGTVFGALLGMGLTAVAFPVGWHLTGIAVAAAVAGLWTVRAIPSGTGREETEAGDGERTGGLRAQLAVWSDRRLVLIGLIVLAMAFAEGSANDWLPLLMVDGHGTSATAGSLTFMLFAVAMTTGRFAGGPLLVRFGPAAVVRRARSWRRWGWRW